MLKYYNELGGVLMGNLYKINDFEGPLDLLLHLIKENKMDIFEIEVLSLINQYLEYVKQAQELDLEVTADFLLMAATLLEIKSKLLLPKPEIEISDEYEEDQSEILIKKLIAYKQYKEISQELKENNKQRGLVYIKPVDDLSQFMSKQPELVKGEVDLYDLIKSFNQLMKRQEMLKPLETKMLNQEISVEQRCLEIESFINDYHGHKIYLKDLLKVPTKSYLIVTFLAVLDLVKHHKIKLYQHHNFEEIRIEGV